MEIRGRGLTNRIHVNVDAGGGRPISQKLSPDQAHDTVAVGDLADQFDPTATLLADKGYSCDAIRALAGAAGAWANIPPRRNRKKTFVFSKRVYRQRNVVECFLNKLKQFYGMATRCDKLPENYLATIKLASVRTWLRGYMPTT